MTLQDFTAKLIPFFTPSQIGKLDAVAVHGSIDAYGKPETLNELRDLASDGRYFVIDSILNDYIESDPDFIDAMIGEPMTDKKRQALIKWLDTEW